MSTTDRYANMTQQDFNTILRNIAEDDGTNRLLDIPGVWEAAAEHYNNAVLEYWLEDHPEDDEDDSEVPEGPELNDPIFDMSDGYKIANGYKIALASPSGYVESIDGQDPDDDDVWIVNGGTRIVWEDSCWQIAYDKAGE